MLRLITTVRDFTVYGDDDVAYECSARFVLTDDGVEIDQIWTPKDCPNWKDDRVERAALREARDIDFS